MMISRTPLRVSFCGGGSDLAAYYENSHEGGCVTSLSLARYIHVTVNRRFDDDIRLSYSKTEIVQDFEDLQHELVREAMRMVGITGGVEITTIADIPSRGTGLGSSSAVTVGLLSALYEYVGKSVLAMTLAEQACQIEIEILGQPIGRQDQYGCAVGGVNHIRFLPDGTTVVEPLNLSEEIIQRMSDEFTLLYTGKTRSAVDLLAKQSADTPDNTTQLQRMCEQAREVRDALLVGDLEQIGNLLHEGWELKRQLASGISIPEIDELYETVRSCGATGGKLLGAGGGGFILFHGGSEVRQKVAQALPEHRMLPLEVARKPVEIIFSE
jgi:D-glycero-alpha-D-manno-heptose-7-phosphate kinase